LIGAIAISGLPPLNGFVSEFLIYLASLRGATAMGADVAIALFLAVGSLALIGGLAAACFTKAFGIVFLGEPRSQEAAHAGEAQPLMLVPMLLLAAACIGVGLLGMVVVPALSGVVSGILGFNAGPELKTAALSLRSITIGSVALLLLIALVAWLRRFLLSGRRVESTVTWDCGYSAPTARMQYSASSFGQPITALFRSVLQTSEHAPAVQEYFPEAGSFETHTPDACCEKAYRPLFEGLRRLCGRCVVLQHGNVHLYVLYIVITLVGLLVWQMR
jgi:NADH:ubiquinone oxidoreductase subunit 5 (subunit L)/multisubunit Na+/H+ antiporter MnhA subunit